MNVSNKPLTFATLILVMFLLMSCLHGPVSNSSGGDWNVTIWASSSCIQPGDNIHLKASVTNNRGTLEVIDVKDKPVLDITIGRASSAVAYVVHWSDGRPLAADLTHLELKPGESKTIEMDWVAPSTGGTFGVDAIFRDPELGGYEVRPGVTIYAGGCPGFGP